MAKKLLCAKGCGKPFTSENKWKDRHEDKCNGEKEKEQAPARPNFKPAHHDPEEDLSTNVAETITLPKKPAPNGSGMAAAIAELREKRKARLLEVQEIDSLITQLEKLS